MLIGELAEKAGVSKDTIRHYDELKLLVVGERVAGSRRYREFLEENIGRVQMIRSAKLMGFTLNDVKKMMTQYDSGQLSDQEVFELLEEQLQLVRGKMDELRQIELRISEKLAKMKQK
ncbi:MAG: MerR family transcriptional regulator [Cellvibrionaceae bacterium]|nr:MerR family transcriptional regulator [Cellvibrionaceae bacterium]